MRAARGAWSPSSHGSFPLLARRRACAAFVAARWLEDRRGYRDLGFVFLDRVVPYAVARREPEEALDVAAERDCLLRLMLGRRVLRRSNGEPGSYYHVVSAS